MVSPWIIVREWDAHRVVIEGSYGSLPWPVSMWCSALSNKIKSNSDLFMRLIYWPMLITVRERVTSFIGVSDINEVVLVPNTSHGVNTVLKNFIWEAGHVIVTCETSYILWRITGADNSHRQHDLWTRVPNELIYQHLYLIHNHDISMHCTYRHCLIYQLQWAHVYSLSLPIIGPCYRLATCRWALLLKLEMASWVHHHKFVSCYDRKACLHRIIFVSVQFEAIHL